MSTLGRNQPCHCGSGKKYKRCHGTGQSSAALSEVARIGPRWVNQGVVRIFESALSMEEAPTPLPAEGDQLSLQNWATMFDSEETFNSEELTEESLEQQELGGDAEVELDVHALEGASVMNESGEIHDENSLSRALRSLHIDTPNHRDRRLLSQLKLSLSQSVFEPLEIIEVLRGSGLKVRGVISGRTVQINQPEDADLLEPMEWIYGRVIIFGRRAYLLSGWEKVGFRARKGLRSELSEGLAESDTQAERLTWLRQRAEWILERCRIHRASNAAEV